MRHPAARESEPSAPERSTSASVECGLAESSQTRHERAHAGVLRLPGRGDEAFDDDILRGRCDQLSRELYGHQGGESWRLANTDRGRLVADDAATPERSALTGTDDPPPAHRSRRYDEAGGLRRPLAEHQRELVRHWPVDEHGNLRRTPTLDHA